MRVKTLFLTFIMLLVLFNVKAEEDYLYNGIITHRFANSITKVYKMMDTNSPILKILKPGEIVHVIDVYPNWMQIENENTIGYVLRHRIDVVGTKNQKTTPKYPAQICTYYAVIDHTISIYSDKSKNSKILTSLSTGAKIAFLGFEDGWGKTIYLRQYGYINSQDLSEIIPISADENNLEPIAPLSVFTSFCNDNENRINNLINACKLINIVIPSGNIMNFNDTVGPFSKENGYMLAPVLIDGKIKYGYGGGSCQISSTLWCALIQLPGITTLMRKPHGNSGASYLPHGMDASSGTDSLNLIIRNDYGFPIRIEASVHDHAVFVSIWRNIE